MPFRVSPEDKTPAYFERGQHVLVDASGAGQGRYVMAAVCVDNGQITQLLSSPCIAVSSVEAEKECIDWALGLMPKALVWNDCIPAIEAVLKLQPELTGCLLWPPPKMRKPFHDMAHHLSILARELTCPRVWTFDELNHNFNSRVGGD
jgi:hypothetical protein